MALSPTSSRGSGGSSQPIQNGAGSPAGFVTPTAKGYLYIDTNNGAVWIATGTTNTSWVAVGGITEALRTGDGTYGVGSGTGGHLFIIPTGANLVEIITADGMANTGNEVSFGGADGNEVFEIHLGSSRQYLHQWGNNGVYRNANGIIFPTADPHVADAWWNNAGTLTKSSG